ncbi:MAG: Gfo/Idh/MocA family oxidoreductase [Microthrixaceae bacterium]
MARPEQPAAPLRYGIIGSGMMGCEHILNLNEIDDAVVVAVAEPNEEPRGWTRACLGERADDVPMFDDHRALLEGVDLDAVVVATPNFHHIEVLRDVLATDAHVMCEKPLCTTVADAREARDLARARPAVSWMGLEYRYMPTVARFVDALAAGAAGGLVMLSIREHRFPFLTKIEHWNRFSAKTGGTLVEKCCHFFDLMRLVAQSDPVRVMASGGQDVNHLDELIDGRRPDILDNAFVVVEFASGLRAQLDLCMFAEGAPAEQHLLGAGSEARVESWVPGARVEVQRRDGTIEEIAAPMWPEVTYEGFHHGSSFMEHLGFIQAIRTGSPPAVTFDDGLWAVAMGAAAHRSIDEGRVVTLAELGAPW